MTDINIPQSKSWQDRTDYIKDLFPRAVPPLDGYTSLKEMLYYCACAIRVLRHYDVVVTADIKLTQLLAMYRRLFFIRKPRQVVLELMLDEQRAGIAWKLKVLLQRFVFSSVDLVFVSSTGEVETYSRRLKKRREEFRFLPFHTNVVRPERTAGGNGYIFSAGKTGRDFAVLADALRGTDIRAVVVSDEENVRGVEIPGNMVVRKNVSYDEYLRLLEGSLFVVVPLKRCVKSTGQVVILEAMALGKPVIATQTVGTVDYVDHGKNGLLVPVSDREALRRAIVGLKADPALQEELAKEGLRSVEQLHTFEKYINAILDASEELAWRS